VSNKAPAGGFEQTLAELEALVARMEAGDLSLEDALRSFERGVQLTRECQQALQSAQQKVHILSQKGGDATLQDFVAPADAAADGSDNP